MMIQTRQQHKKERKKKFQRKSGECSGENTGFKNLSLKILNPSYSRSHSLSDVGTGGTPFMVYLKSIRDATDAAKL